MTENNINTIESDSLHLYNTVLKLVKENKLEIVDNVKSPSEIFDNAKSPIRNC